MKAKSLRSILGFYSAEGEPEAAYQAVRGATRGRVFFFKPDQAYEPGRRHHRTLRRAAPGRRIPNRSRSRSIRRRVDGQAASAHWIAGGFRIEGRPGFRAVSGMRRNRFEADPFSIERQRSRTGSRAPRFDGSGSLGPRVDRGSRVVARQCVSGPHPDRGDSPPSAAQFFERSFRVSPQSTNWPRDWLRIPITRSRETNITDWLRENQSTKPLTMAELWFFPLLLRMALIEALRQLAFRVSLAQQLRETAYLWANRLAAAARRGTRGVCAHPGPHGSGAGRGPTPFRDFAGGAASGRGNRARSGAALDRTARRTLRSPNWSAANIRGKRRSASPPRTCSAVFARSRKSTSPRSSNP